MNIKLKTRKRSAASPADPAAAASRRRYAMIVGTGAAAVVFAVIVMTGLSLLLTAPPPATTTAPEPSTERPKPATPVARIKATLFFGSEDGQRLVGTQQDVPLADGVMAQARSIIEAQLAADPPPPLVATIPKGVTLRGLFVSGRGEVFVDLDPSIKTSHPGGSTQELMTVYTIVNALITNLPDVQEVQILIGGQEVDTLAGHVDLRRPLKKNEGLILPPGPPTPPSTQ